MTVGDPSPHPGAAVGPAERGNDSPLFSAVVPTLDTLELTSRCVESLIASGLCERTIIVVDDGSSDGTVEHLRASWPSLEIVENRTRLGFSSAVNRGVEHSDPATPFLAIVNSDTIVSSSFFQKALQEFANDQRLGIFAPRLVYPDGTDQWSCALRFPSLLWLAVNASTIFHRIGSSPKTPPAQHDPAATSAVALPVAWVPATCIALRRKLWTEAGPFNDAYALYAQDLDLCTRAHLAGWRIVCDHSVSVVHEHGATVEKTSSGARDLPALLTDLYVWARRHRGRPWAELARIGMIAGTLVGLLLAPFIRYSSTRSRSRPPVQGVGYHRRWLALIALLKVHRRARDL